MVFKLNYLRGIIHVYVIVVLFVLFMRSCL